MTQGELASDRKIVAKLPCKPNIVKGSTLMAEKDSMSKIINLPSS